MFDAHLRRAPRVLTVCAAAWLLCAGIEVRAEEGDSVVPVQAVARTQAVSTHVRPRCGEAARVPVPSFWGRMGAMLGGGPAEGEIPPPVFERVQVCTEAVAHGYAPARYRVEYRFGGEDYSVDLAYDPGDTVRVDGTGRVIGPAPRR